MNSVKDYLQEASHGLERFETALRGAVVNQNIADIVASARAKLLQAASHPDAETELSKLAPRSDDPGGPFAPFEGSSKQGSG